MNDFRMGQFDIIQTENEPDFSNMASGVLWVPDLDTWRLSTASGVREMRTGHGIVQVSRTADATAQTFTTTFTDVIWDAVNLIDEQYYSLSSTLITVKEPGIYRVSYNQSISVNAGTSRSAARTRIELDGVALTQGLSHSYHRTAGGGIDGAASSCFVEVGGPGLQISIASARVQGTSTLQYIVGCNCAIERISPLRNPTSPGFEDGGD